MIESRFIASSWVSMLSKCVSRQSLPAVLSTICQAKVRPIC